MTTTAPPETPAEVTRPFTADKLDELQAAVEQATGRPYVPLADPVHGGDVFSRIEAFREGELWLA